MASYGPMYRFGVTPWERYFVTAGASIAAQLDREEADRPGRGRALDLGCGRGLYSRALAKRGWETLGIDAVPAAIEKARAAAGASYAVRDVTDLVQGDLGTFDFFLDVGCFQGLGVEERAAAGAGVTGLANPGATLLMLEFGISRYRRVIGGVSQADVVAAFPDWDLLSVEPASTAGLGWPMSRTRPQWLRLRIKGSR